VSGQAPDQIGSRTGCRKAGDSGDDGEDRVQHADGRTSHDSHRGRTRSWRGGSGSRRCGGGRGSAWNVGGRRSANCRCGCPRGTCGRSAWRQCRQLDRRGGRRLRRQIDTDSFFLGLDFARLLLWGNRATWSVGNVVCHNVILVQAMPARWKCQRINYDTKLAHAFSSINSRRAPLRSCSIKVVE
jgi:hypothetical protein